MLGASGQRDGRSALRVTLDQTACRAVDEIRAYHVTTHLEPSGARSIGKVSIGQGVVTADCVWNSGEVEPGEYEVWFQRNGVRVAIREFARRDTTVLLGQDREGTAHRGNNRMDWLLEGGTLKVMPVGWDRKEKIQLWIVRKRPWTGMWYGVALPVEADRLPLTMTGLAFGTYELQLTDHEDNTTVSDVRTVTIDAQNSESSLELAVTGPKPR